MIAFFFLPPSKNTAIFSPRAVQCHADILMIIPGRLLVFITVLHNGSVAVARRSSRPEAVNIFFLPPDKDNATNALLAVFHFYLTLGGRLSLMRVDNMASGFQRC